MLSSTSTFALRSGALGGCQLRRNRPTPPCIRGPLRVAAFVEGEDKQAPYQVPAMVPAFTRRRERAVGRVAMFGVACAWTGEVLTGLGPLSQLSHETGVPLPWVYSVTAALALSQFLLATNRDSPTFDRANQLDVSKRTKGLTGRRSIEPDTDQRISLTRTPGKFFLRSELVLGRAAMLIFAGSALAELTWGGQAPLAHVGLMTPGTPLALAPLWLKLGIALFGAGSLGLFSGFDSNKDADTY